MTERAPCLPTERGPLSAAVIEALSEAPGPRPFPRLEPHVDMLGDDDGQLALWLCYQLSYSSFTGVDEEWEWEPSLLGFRAEFERAMLDRLVDEIGPPPSVPPQWLAVELDALAHGDGPSLSAFVADHGTREHVREFLVHRSAYQLKEADAHTWVIPRLRGAAKAAAVSIQYDEYGEGETAAMHAELFAVTMGALGLDASFGAYVDLLPGTTLATDNLTSLFGLHRRWRGACVGHLALFEMTSIVPMGRYAQALTPVGAPTAAREFYDVHVEADARHERIALDDMVAGLVQQSPELAGDVLFGARALTEVEQRFARTTLDAWEHGVTSLLRPLAADRRAS
jgi:hypothetical protein